MANRDDAQNLQQAFSLHRSGRFAQAAKLYRKVIRKNPREANALHSLGIIESAGGNLTEAAQLMARSVSVQPANIQFIQNYVTVLCGTARRHHGKARAEPDRHTPVRHVGLCARSRARVCPDDAALPGRTAARSYRGNAVTGRSRAVSLDADWSGCGPSL